MEAISHNGLFAMSPMHPLAARTAGQMWPGGVWEQTPQFAASLQSTSPGIDGEFTTHAPTGAQSITATNMAGAGYGMHPFAFSRQGW
jgi:hypothetical protein